MSSAVLVHALPSHWMSPLGMLIWKFLSPCTGTLQPWLLGTPQSSPVVFLIESKSLVPALLPWAATNVCASSSDCLLLVVLMSPWAFLCVHSDIHRMATSSDHLGFHEVVEIENSATIASRIRLDQSCRACWRNNRLPRVSSSRS